MRDNVKSLEDDCDNWWNTLLGSRLESRGEDNVHEETSWCDSLSLYHPVHLVTKEDEFIRVITKSARFDRSFSDTWSGLMPLSGVLGALVSLILIIADSVKSENALLLYFFHQIQITGTWEYFHAWKYLVGDSSVSLHFNRLMQDTLHEVETRVLQCWQLLSFFSVMQNLCRQYLWCSISCSDMDNSPFTYLLMVSSDNEWN